VSIVRVVHIVLMSMMTFEAITVHGKHVVEPHR